MSSRSAQKEPSNGSYVYSSRARPPPARPRNSNEVSTSYGNISCDGRGVRGSAYLVQRIPIPPPVGRAEIKRQQEAKKRTLTLRRVREQRTLEAVEGRTHVDVQTELYLEELSDDIEADHVECQTDAFVDRPPTPLFVPAKTGKDVGTHIDDGELFDFDMEVQPVLEVLVGKTVEQSLLEVMEEEELACLQAQQRAFRELRDAELAEVQRLEEQDRRHRQEKSRRIAQQREVLEKERELVEKIAAQAFTHHYLADLLPSVHTTLGEQGYFYDAVERDIETNFFPWLMDEVSSILEKRFVARDVLDLLILEVTQKRMDGFQVLDS